jgi:hypothetical protein
MLEGTHPWLTASPSVLSGKNRTAYLFISLFLFLLVSFFPSTFETNLGLHTQL